VDLEVQLANVVRSVGTRRRSTNLQGQEVERVESVYLSTHHQWYPCLNTDTHFMYKSKSIGSSTLCTCGSPAVCVSYGQYKRYASFMGMEVMACQSLIQNGVHFDRSS